MQRLSQVSERQLGSFKRLWASRWLLKEWVERDFQVRYRQTALGLAWTIVQPIALLISYGGIFSQVLNVRSTDGPYIVFAFSGLTAWSFVSSAMALSVQSFASASSLIRQVYFPREIAPLSAAGVAMGDLVVSTAILVGLQAFVGNGLHVSLILLPLVYLGLFLFVAGLGLILAAATVFIRDIRQAVPLALQVVFIATPIVYPSSQVPHRLHLLVALNPLSYSIAAVRSVVINGGAPSSEDLFLPLVSGAIMLFLGLRYVRSVEGRFPDVM